MVFMFCMFLKDSTKPEKYEKASSPHHYRFSGDTYPEGIFISEKISSPNKCGNIRLL